MGTTGRTAALGHAGRRGRWKLEDAKARFSELVRRARNEGPQRITCRGQDTAVLLSAEDYDRLTRAKRPRQPLVAFLQSTALSELDFTRAPDQGRDIAL